MKKNIHSSKLLVIILFTLFTTTITAQSNTVYNYSDLSSKYYKNKIDSLKKILKAPKLYTKETQKRYEEFWNDRLDAIYSGIRNNDFVHNTEIENYLAGIVNNIVANNKTLIPTAPLILLDRSASINAYTYGHWIIVINAGLIEYVQSKEELTFIIAHELSHNILNHALNADKSRAEWLTSKEYEASLKEIGNSKYQKLTQLKKLITNFAFSRTKHSRFNESSSDSLAIVLLKNSKVKYNANWMLRLDSSDNFYKKELNKDISAYFNDYNISLSSNLFEKKSLGLSSKKFNIKDTTSLEDSLKTHPDCKQRYNSTLAKSENFKETPINKNLTDISKKILLWNMFDNKSLTACMYRIFTEKDMQNKDPWYDFMLFNTVYGFVYSSKTNKRFEAINIIPKEFTSKKYFQLQTMLEQIKTEELETAYNTIGKNNFWNTLNNYEKALKSFMIELNNNYNNSEKTLNKIVSTFQTDNGSSMYMEFAEHFSTKIK